jgi:hypothetical protein
MRRPGRGKNFEELAGEQEGAEAGGDFRKTRV